jgi:hypothetical protein
MKEQAHSKNGTTPASAAMPLSDGATPKAQLVAQTTVFGRTLDGVASHSLHWNTFMTARVQENIKLSKRLSEVRSPLEVHAAFADYWQVATAHFQSAVAKSFDEVKSGTRF